MFVVEARVLAAPLWPGGTAVVAIGLVGWVAGTVNMAEYVGRTGVQRFVVIGNINTQKERCGYVVVRKKMPPRSRKARVELGGRHLSSGRREPQGSHQRVTCGALTLSGAVLTLSGRESVYTPIWSRSRFLKSDLTAGLFSPEISPRAAKSQIDFYN